MVIMSHYVFPDSFRCATLVIDNAKCPRGSMTFTSSVETIPALSPMKKASDGGSSRRKKRSVSIKNSIRRFEAEQAQKNNAQQVLASASADANISGTSVVVSTSTQRGSTNRRDQQSQQQPNNQRSSVPNNSKLPSNPLVITPLSRGPIRERRNGKTRSTSNGNKSTNDDSIIKPKISLSTTPPKQPSRERSASDDSKNNDTSPPPLLQRQESIIAYGSVVSEIKKLGKLDFNTSMSSLSPPPIPQRKTSLLVALQERSAQGCFGDDDFDLNLDDLNSSLLSRVTEVDEFHNSFINPPIMPVRQLSILHNNSSDNFDNNNNNRFQSTTNASTKGMMRNNKGKDLLGSFIGEYDHDFMQLETTPKG